MTSISIIGLGLMGTALAETLITAGHTVTVWNRTDSKANALVAKGAARAGSVAEAVRASPLVIVCVLDYDAAHAALESADLTGKALVNLTSGRPAEARRTAEWARERGADYLDGGIMAVPQMIGNPGALILYSGSKSVFDTYEEALKALADARFVGADAGLAPLLDLAMLTGMYGQIAGSLQAIALVRSEGIAAGEFTTSLLLPWLRAMGDLLPRWAEEIDKKNYETDVSNLNVNKVGLASLSLATREQGVETNLLAPLQHIVDRRVADGHGSHGLPSLIEELS